MSVRRRTMIKGLAAGAGLALLGTTRKSGSAPELPQKRLLVIAAEGGKRATISTNPADPQNLALNPWGVVDTGGFKLGSALFSDPALSYAAPSWLGGAVPDLGTMFNLCSRIGAADHAPNGGYRSGDHFYEGYAMATGSTGGDKPGLAVLCNRYLVTAQTPLPACIIGFPGSPVGGPLAHAVGDWKQYVPPMLDAQFMPAAGGAISEPVGLGSALEDALDARARDRRRNLARAALETFVRNKGALRAYGPLLADGVTHLADPAFAGEAHDGISNQMLLEAVGAVSEPFTDTSPSEPDLFNHALALRLLQLGSPAVFLSFQSSLASFDTHSQEQFQSSYLFSRWGRGYAGLLYALANIPDPANADQSMLDSTLVVTASEFSRSLGAEGGYPERDGSDHGLDVWRYQDHELAGMGNIAGAELAKTDFYTGLPEDGAAAAVPTQALLHTVATKAGIPADVCNDLWPEGSDVYPSGHDLEALFGA